MLPPAQLRFAALEGSAFIRRSRGRSRKSYRKKEYAGSCLSKNDFAILPGRGGLFQNRETKKSLSCDQF
jgi:hypothetical protein